MVKSVEKRGNGVKKSFVGSKRRKFKLNVPKISRTTDDVDMSGVVYLSRLPWGFEEEPMEKYFKQFGGIKQMRVSRSKKTGRSRGYAFVQFYHDQVAKIVAESMNNYIMFGKLIKCRHLPNPHPDTFKSINKKLLSPSFKSQQHEAVLKHNSIKSKEVRDKAEKKALDKFTKLKATLAESGINFQPKEIEEHMEVVKQKRELRLEEMKDSEAKRKHDSDDDDDDDDSEDSSNENDDESDSDDDDSVKAVFSAMGTKVDKTKLAKKPLSVPSTPKSAQKPEKASLSTTKRKDRLSMIPNEVDTPKGKRNVLIEDSSEDEIEFKTPPMSIRSSKLDQTLESLKPTTPAAKTSPKRKAEGVNTPVSTKKLKKTPGGPKQVIATPKTPNMDKRQAGVSDATPKSKSEIDTPVSAKKMKKTPGGLKQANDTPKTPNMDKKQSGGKDTILKGKPATNTPASVKKVKTPGGPKQLSATPKTPNMDKKQSGGNDTKKILKTPMSEGRKAKNENSNRKIQSAKKAKTPKL
ncbi:hypothetical protein ACF0H5_012138 [Mactra antiquata]